jgi:hypothetical protein
MDLPPIEKRDEWEKKLMNECKSGDLQRIIELIERGTCHWNDRRVDVYYWNKGLYAACYGGNIPAIE